MLKRMLAMVLVAAAVLACCVMPASAATVASGNCGTNLSWTLDNAGTLTISGNGAMTDYESYSAAPWYNNRTSIKKVVIKSGVTTVGDYAFYYCDMVSVSIPSSVTIIGDYAFYSCDDLTAVNLPGNVTTIGNRAFAFCYKVTALSIPNSVTTIGERAFYGAFRLTSLSLGSGVTSIGAGAFLDCDGLTSVSIPASVKSIGLQAFYGDAKLTGIYVNSQNTAYSSDSRGVLFNKNKTVLIQAPGGIAGSYSVPTSVTLIDEYAFASCYNLTAVTIPGSVTTIKNNAFAYCDKLSKVNLSAGLTTIGDSAFYSCDSLTSLTTPNTVLSIGDLAYANCNKLTKVNLSASVASIGDSAFYSCDSLTAINVNSGNTAYSNDTKGVLFNKNKSVLLQAPGGMTGSYSIPAGTVTIDDYAFYSCAKLTTVIIPNTVVTVKNDAFAYCDSLSWVTIPNSVTTIGSSAFYRCKSLSAVTIPTSVTTIGSYMFDYSALKDVYYAGNAAKWSGIDIGKYNDTLNAAKVHYETIRSFPDVKTNAWYYKAVEWSVKKGYFSGNGDGTFGPSNDITRQDFAVVLARIAKADLSKYSGKTSFNDVSSGAYYAKAIHWASSNQVIMGLNNTKFGVGNKLTREQLVTILYRYAKKMGANVSVSAADRAKLNAYKDAGKVSSYAKDAFAWALKNKVISGMDATTLGPTVTATRAQVATILMNINSHKVIPGI